MYPNLGNENFGGNPNQGNPNYGNPNLMNPNYGNQNMGKPSIGNQVPQPVRKDYGPQNQNLLSDGTDETKRARASNVTISFGQIGSFTHNQPKLLPAPQEQLEPTVRSIPTKETEHVYKLSKDECKEALLKQISGCCTSKKPAEEGHMTNIISYNALEYVLETYNEKRSLACAYSACRPGETINAIGSGQIPDPWSVPCQPSSNYKDEVKKVNLPFTECIQPCHACNAYGQLKCAGCDGTGRKMCGSCNGQRVRTDRDAAGNVTQSPCGSCQTTGFQTCTRCSSDGRTTCDVCQGVQLLKWFLQVQVQYINHVDKYIKEKTDLPDELISTVKGEILGENEGKQLPPMSDSDSKDIADNSVRLIQKANQSYAQEKRVIQRHKLVCVTCTECAIEYNGQNFKFWVYGEERKVHCPEYPGGGCCCTII